MPQPDERAVIDTIMARRSVRDGFVPRPVAREDLDLIIRCGLSAPSSKNAQPWRFHVVTSERTLIAIADAVIAADGADAYVPHDPRTGAPHSSYVSTVRESAVVLCHAAATIFIENRGVFSGGREQLLRATSHALNEALMGYGLEMLGLGAAIENMWLSANSLGLGVAFLGDVLIAESAIRRHIGSEGDIVGVLAIGHVEASSSQTWPLRGEGLVRWH